MKCRFCGKRIKKNSNMCEYCGKEINEGMDTDELIDAMPEIRDEFDKISELQEKEKKKEEKKEKRAKGRKKRVVTAVVLVVVILACVVGGIYYYTNKEKTEDSKQEVVLTTTAIDAQFQKSFAGGGFTNLAVLDAASAKESINGAKAAFNIQDVEKEFELVKEFSIGDSKIYRFRQMYEGIPVFGGEVVIMADAAGGAKAVNIAYVETKGLTTSYAIDEGKASAAITEYVNALSDNYSVVNGVKISDIRKTVCNTEGKTYLAYCANVSGYNRNGEYIAYDVFVDGISGNGICTVVTSSFETAAAEVTEDEVEESYIYKMITVNDKFKWNDDTVETAKGDIKISDVTDGNASEYVISIKKAVDDAYKYFDSTFGWKGLDGAGGEFEVYINPNEYVEDNLPAEKAMYTNGKLMFFREDLTQGEVDYNTVVHEYAHGVIENIAAMCGTRQINENAAIAEGIADVLAELAESKLTGEVPDWVHGVRNLAMPDMNYHISTAEAPQILSIEECYEYSTIVSHMAAFMSDYIGMDAQNEIWFKTMCMMTRHTDFADFSGILEAIVDDMYAYSKIDIDQYSAIKTGIEMLGASEQDFYSMEQEMTQPETVEEETVEITEE